MEKRKRKNKRDPTMYYLQETCFRFKDKNSSKVKGWEQIYPSSSKEKRAVVDILVWYKMKFKIKLLEETLLKWKEGQSIRKI